MRTQLISVIGSYMHGLQHENSDLDTRIIAVTPLDTMLSPFTAGSIKPKHEVDDTVTYELRHFLSLLSTGSPSIVDIVYSPLTEACSPFGDVLLRHRRKFINGDVVFKNLKAYCLNMVKRAADGTRPYKSVRSALLTANVILAYMEDRDYDPLTIVGRCSILNSSDEMIEGMRSTLLYLLAEMEELSIKNDYDPEFVRQFNIAAYMEGYKHDPEKLWRLTAQQASKDT